MECNRADAERSKEIAETKFRQNDIAGAKKFALKAKALFKPLEGIDQMILTLEVHLRAQKKIEGENDWYGILEVSPLANEEVIKKQYKKLAFQTHPDKNSSISAEGAFNLISDAWSVLSNAAKRMEYDRKRHMCGLRVQQNNCKSSACNTSKSSVSSVNGFRDRSRKAPPHLVPDTFWTHCFSCYMSFQYSREFINRHLKCPVCQAVFVAVEVPPPSSPIYPNGPMHSNDNNIGGDTIPGMATTGVQSGVTCGNQNSNPAVRKSTATCSSGVREEESGAGNIAGNEEASFPRKAMQDVRKHAHAGSSVRRANAATREHEAAKRRRVSDGMQATEQSANSCHDGDKCKPMHPAKRKPRSRTEASGAKKRKMSSGDLNGRSSGTTEGTSFGRVLMQLDVRGILIENTKRQLLEKLKGVSSKKASTKNKEKLQINKKRSTKSVCGTATEVNKIGMKQSSNSVHPKQGDAKELVSKRVDSEEEQIEKKGSRQVGLEEKKSWQRRSPEIRIVYTRRNRKEHKKEVGDHATGVNPAIENHVGHKYGCSNQEPSPDEGSGVMPVPDADFFKFGDHPGSSFKNDQVWAVYDEEDGMPRYYALIRKVISTHPFKVRLAYLKANDCNEFATSNWITYGYSKTCGEFQDDMSKDTEQLNIFSHKVKYERGPGGIIRILPKKGDIWALYQNWSPDWDEFTPDDTMYKYELVEALDSYSPTKGISVAPIVKVPGFVSVFKPFHDAKRTWRIPKEEMLRFSHQVPFHVLTGEEARNAPKGCYELDPGSTPQELLQVVPPSGDVE